MPVKLADLTVGGDGSWSSGPHAMGTGGPRIVTLRRKSDGAVLLTRRFTMKVSVSDDFNRASLGTNWGIPQSGNNLTLSGNKITVGDGVYTATTFAQNQYAETRYGVPLVRAATSSAGRYGLQFSSGDDGDGGTIYFVQVTKGMSGTVGSPFDLGYAVPGAIRRLEATGSNPTTLTIKLGSTHGSLTTIGSVQDSSSPVLSGAPGFSANDANGVDDWYGGDLP